MHEMLIAGTLVGLIVLLLLGSWRATVIVWTSISLSILTAIIGLHWLEETINVMTLGGLALAVGILVDDATVMIENIDRHPLCIAIVWLPLFQLGGVAGYLFKPMAEAVIIAMFASFILSRTLVPTMAKYMMKGHHVPAT
jgi:multidrug efflux pump subunit AcrB